MSLDRLLAQNRNWSNRMQSNDPRFFKRLEKQQAPEYVWIGCSDSRVPANQILDLDPGEVFTHRNIANVVAPNDVNALSVLQFAVDVLKVRHVMVVGHYGCGGIRAALENRQLGFADKWIQHVHQVRDKHVTALDQCPEEDRPDRLCELNVAEQFINVCRSDIAQDAWRRGQTLSVHGLVYRLSDGLLKTLGLSATDSVTAEQTYLQALRPQEIQTP